MAYYYPEGYFGPICDDGLDDLELISLQRAAIVPEDELVVVQDNNLGDDYITILGEPVLKVRSGYLNRNPLRVVYSLGYHIWRMYRS